MGTKFTCTTKFWYVQSGDGVKKPILQFKEDRGDRYERYRIWYDQQSSICFFQPVKFFIIYFYFQSICGVLADCR